MKPTFVTIVSGLIFVGTPLSVFANTAMASTSGVPLAVTVGVLAIGATGMSYWERQNRDCDGDSSGTMAQHLGQYETYWRMRERNTYSPSEIESAICAFETYVEKEGMEWITDVNENKISGVEEISKSMLEHAAVVYPAAYRELERRGKEDQTTKLARTYFLEVVQSAMRERELVVYH